VEGRHKFQCSWCHLGLVTGALLGVPVHFSTKIEDYAQPLLKPTLGTFHQFVRFMAERGRFELPIELPLCLISSQVHSTGLCHLSAACGQISMRRAGARRPAIHGEKRRFTESSDPHFTLWDIPIDRHAGTLQMRILSLLVFRSQWQFCGLHSYLKQTPGRPVPSLEPRLK
jgi:hypothetical protein